ncbi:hypothetical protein VMCG_02660 [Cytospora schulzeri]|uniref:Uncharacterized protein n=1 Tax=Cytospora schulzeri TaxID=448051 RepID=A0A423X1S2_9PEZI|nr:hypothetical protein VMCG_02660 [Valsa malicola]
MPRIVRRRPLLERIKSALDPWDLFLWISEEIETRELGSKSMGTEIGIALNAIFLITRANSAHSTDVDDVFGDAGDSDWLAYIASSFSWLLAALSTWNLIYTFWRSRAYRFFEADVEQPASTPSAQRVRVQSAPAAPSPLRLLSELAGESAEARAHPDKTRDVWELHLWDPLPASLQLLCLFSPVHVLIYMFALPLAPLDPHPSVTVFKCLVEQVALSAMLLVLESAFSQQNKDSALIQKEVMREYDTKFVHPRLHPVVRDVGIQCGEDDSGYDHDDVAVGTPSTLIRRGFQTHPNQNYLKHVDPDSVGQTRSSRSVSPQFFTPATKPSRPTDIFQSIHKPRPSPLRRSTPAASTPVPFEKSTMTNAATSTGTNYGGSLGVYSHSRSPLKKAANINEGGVPFSPRNSRDMAAIEQKDLADRMVGRSSSPVKENQRPGSSSSMQLDGQVEEESQSSQNPFANVRTMSFASSLKKLLPGNKPERGHTLRKRGYHYSETIDDASSPASKSGGSATYGQQNPADKLVRWNTAIEPPPSTPSISTGATPGSRTQQLYLERREKRRLRRSLKESGDFLGVQGINPATGELDVLTPSSSSAGEFSSLARAVQDRRESYESARRQLEAEKMRKWERDKQAIRAEHRSNVRWTKKRSGWSSAIEPNLSPIAQSSAATTPRGEVSTETVLRTPSVRRSSEEYFEQALGPGTTTPEQLLSSIASGLRRNPAPSEDRLSMLYGPNSRPSPLSRCTLSSQRSYSDLIPVESEFPPDPPPKPPKVGPKPVGIYTAIVSRLPKDRPILQGFAAAFI